LHVLVHPAGTACTFSGKQGTCALSPSAQHGQMGCDIGQWAACKDQGAAHRFDPSKPPKTGGACTASGLQGTCEVGGRPRVGNQFISYLTCQLSEARTGTSGASASLDAAGFLQTTSLCCPVEMETFFNRLLDSMGHNVCSKPHVQGLMHWFSCAPAMDFQYMIGVINNGNPCKYWAPKSTTCPILSSECQGKWCS